MSISTSLAASATNMNSAQLQYNVSMSVTKKAMDVQENIMQGMVNMMNQNPPGMGQNLDVRA